MPDHKTQTKTQKRTSTQMIPSAHKNTPCLSYAEGVSVFQFCASSTALHTGKTLLRIGTQVELP